MMTILDNDGLSNNLEDLLGLDKNDPFDADTDLDNDGIGAKYEYAYIDATNKELGTVSCEYGVDPDCSIGRSTPEPLHEDYLNNSVYPEGSLNEVQLNRLHITFEGDLVDQSFESSWLNIDATPEWIKNDTEAYRRVNDRLDNYILIGEKEGVFGYGSITTDQHAYGGSRSVALSSATPALTFNPLTNEDYLGEFGRALASGTISFAYKMDPAFTAGERLELVATRYDESSQKVLFSTGVKSWGWTKVSVTNSAPGAYQLSWRFVGASCTTNCSSAPKVYIDSVTVPFDRNNGGMPVEYRALLGEVADSDGLSLLEEYKNNTNPNVDDTDSDGLDDFVEVNDAKTSPTTFDSDSDGLSDGQEVNDLGTNPLLLDTDGDGLSDGDEVNTHLSNPLNVDSDGDGINDFDEVNTHSTSPINSDTDGDGLSDSVELNEHNTDPTVKDSDGDGIWDGVEVLYAFDPNVPNTGDTDGDGVSDVDEAGEYGIGTNPTSNTDNDRDGLRDDYEVYLNIANLTLAQLWADSDGDGLVKALESVLQTNASQKDNDSYRYFNDQTYTDMLTRMALAHIRGTLQISDTDLATLQSDLGITTQTPAYDVYAKVASPDALLNLSFIGRAYKAVLERDAAYTGLNSWRSKLNSGVTELQMVTSFVNSSEFQSKYGSLSDGEFVELVFQNVLGRSPSQSGYDYWVGKLSQPGYTRAHMMLSFVNTPEFMDAQSTIQIVKNIHLAMTGQVIDSAGLARQTTTFDDEGYALESIMRDNLVAYTFFKNMSPQTQLASRDDDADGLPLRAEFTDGLDSSVMDNGVNDSTEALLKQIARELNDEFYSFQAIEDKAALIDADSGDTQLNSFIQGELVGEGFEERKSLVRLFYSVLGRGVASSGYQYWLARLVEGELTLEGIANIFAESAEFEARFGTDLSNSEFIDVAFMNIFNRAVGASGKAYWLDKLDNGMSRGKFVSLLSESAENVGNNVNRDTAEVLHLTLLRLAITGAQQSSFNTAVSGLSGAAYDEAVAGYAVDLIRSTAFINRF
ncbi:DUF4214 domain-containing protein [Pseudoalteromonas sp. GB56]